MSFIKIELKRSFCRWQGIFAFLLILAIFGYAYSCDYLYSKSDALMNLNIYNKYNAYNHFFRAIRGVSSRMFIMIAPLIMVLVCGDSLNIDRHQKMLPLFLTRINYKKYILKKIIALSIVGFVFIFSALLLSYVLASLIFPYTFPSQKGQGAPWFFGNLCLTRPYLYLVMNLCIQGLIGACFSIFALLVSVFVKSRFVGLFIPWLIYLITNVGMEIIQQGCYKPTVLAGEYLYYSYYIEHGMEWLVPLFWLTFWVLFSILTYICFKVSFNKGNLY